MDAGGRLLKAAIFLNPIKQLYPPIPSPVHHLCPLSALPYNPLHNYRCPALPCLALQFVNKLVVAADAPQGVADPQVLFDYRCYLPGGKEELGTDYPPQVGVAGSK